MIVDGILLMCDEWMSDWKLPVNNGDHKGYLYSDTIPQLTAEVQVWVCMTIKSYKITPSHLKSNIRGGQRLPSTDSVAFTTFVISRILICNGSISVPTEVCELEVLEVLFVVRPKDDV